jgi:HSP20 family protein
MTLLPFIRRHDGDLMRMRNEMDDLFGGVLRTLERPFSAFQMWPPIDIAEKDTEITIRAEVPGCKPEDIDISVHGDTLTIRGEKKENKEEKGREYYHSESVYGSFQRDVELPAEVNPERVEAVYKDGVLSVTLPKAEKSKPVKIQVKGE